ncbi:MAG: NAD(P)/FAD-dependent oxidoreductase [Candidatus Altiarchaeota archaeon]
MDVAVVGGGISGLTVAYELAKRGTKVVVFEKHREVGGIAGSLEAVKGVQLEKYYHHFFTNDSDLVTLLRELGLEKSLQTFPTKMGFLCDGKVYPFTSPMDLLRFNPLKILDRIRLGLTLLYLQSLKSPGHLDPESGLEWLRRYAGNASVEKIWGPLLKTKFGSNNQNISASWIWGRVSERGRSRGAKKLKERLNYIQGGCHTLLTRLVDSIVSKGGMIKVGSEVTKLRQRGGKIECMLKNGETHLFDKVVAAVETPTFLTITEGLPADYATRISGIKYNGVICAVIVLKRPLSDVYWLNISDPTISFGGVIEHTNFVPPEYYGGYSIVYLFNYVDKDSHFRAMKDDDIIGLYLADLGRIFPDFAKDSLVRYSMFRDEYATPVYVKGFSQLKPGYVTPTKNVYLVNNTQVYPHGRNLNNLIRNSKDAVNAILKE